MEIFNSNDCFAGRSICTSLLIFIEIFWGQFFVCQLNICQDFSKNLGWFSTIQPTEMSKYGKGAQLFTKFTALRLQFTQIDGKEWLNKVHVTKSWIYILETQTHDCNFLGTGPNKLISPQLFFRWKPSGVHLLAFRKFDFPMRTSTTQWNFHACWSTFLDIQLRSSE